jgi:hypothetical protein
MCVRHANRFVSLLSVPPADALLLPFAAADQMHARGKDELCPLTRSSRDWLHLGLTTVDALDTLLLMRLTDRFTDARAWVVSSLDVAPDVEVNLFETSIRILGGLLSTHHLSAAAGAKTGDPPLVAKAKDLGQRLLVAFNSPSGLPYSDVNLRKKTAKGPDWGPDSSVSEVSTLRLEFSALAAATATPSFAAPAAKAQRAVAALAQQSDGLVAAKFINPASGAWGGGRIMTLGARVDSYYEYLLKAWLQDGKRDAALLTAYQDAVHGVTIRLLARSRNDKLLFIGELDNGRLSPKMDHLVCFYPGLLALGHMHGVRPRPSQAAEQAAALARLGFAPNATQLDVAASLAATCREMYVRNPLGMGPEIAHFTPEGATGGGDDLIIKPLDAHSLLRPEYVESLFVLWRATGQQRFRDWGWDAWRGIERHARVPTGGYASVESVLSAPARLRDHMESFFLGETLKYLYLLFVDDPAVVPLDAWVFNTEAHPLPLPPAARFAAKPAR